MKRFLVSTCLLFVAATLSSQQGGPPKSPSETATATIGGKAISIAYSSPRVNGREGKLFGKDGQLGKDPTYPVWRAGANNATKLHVDGDLRIGDVAVPKGDYTLYVDASDPANWTLIVNKQTGQWGTKYDKAQDLGRTPMTMSKPALDGRKPHLHAGRQRRRQGLSHAGVGRPQGLRRDLRPITATGCPRSLAFGDRGRSTEATTHSLSLCSLPTGMHPPDTINKKITSRRDPRFAVVCLSLHSVRPSL